MKLALLTLLVAIVFIIVITFWPQEEISVITLPQIPVKKIIPEIEPELTLEPTGTAIPLIQALPIPEPPQLIKEIIEEEGGLPPETPINLRSIVVLKCVFKNLAGNQRIAFGSGAIVSEDGTILTARHMLDQKYIYNASGGKQGFVGYELSHCLVGMPRQESTTPTTQEIRSINPFITVDVLPYVAKLEFLPDNVTWSNAEKNIFDVGLLKITNLSEDAGYFGITSLPLSFETSTMLDNQYPQEKDEIITFGFPSGVPDYGSQFKLQGSVGHVRRVIGGDEKFVRQPLEIESVMETISGRSGSPVFWRGYVVGVVSFKEDNSINSFSTSIIPFMKILE